MKVNVFLEFQGKFQEIDAEEADLKLPDTYAFMRKFATHPTIFTQGKMFPSEQFTCSHVDTGCRIATGSTREEAAINAADKLITSGPSRVKAAIKRSLQRIKDLNHG